MNILDAVHDPKVFAQHFRRKESWNAWFVFLCALFALPMTAEQIEIYKACTGRSTPPTAPSHEAWLCIGRRGGKSFILALIATFLACFFDWRPFLGPGEIGTIMIVAQDRKQSRTIMRFILGLLQAVPMLKRQIEGTTRESVSLKNSIIIEVHTASYRSTRGYTVIAALLDELAFWPVDEASAEPDVEVLNAIRPAMATIPGAMLLCASSPYARRGALWDAYRKHFGKDGDPVLVWQAPTRAMNPSVPQSFIDQHMQEDEPRALAEYGAQFRTDLEAFVSREAVMACVSPCIYERPHEHYKPYLAFCDPSGGSSDSFTLAIGHKDLATKMMVVDVLREVKPPFSPEAVCAEFATVLKIYGVSKVIGDRYAGEWPKEQFAKFGVMYEQSAKPKSDLYVDLLAAINSHRVALLDHGKLINQLTSLERRVARSGRDSIDHPPGGHDDLANAVAGLCAEAINKYGNYDTSYRAFQDGFQDEDVKASPSPESAPPLTADVDATPPSAPEPPPPGSTCGTANWWQFKQHLNTYTGSADDELRSAYNAIDNFFRYR
jgi:hypothetical protein